MTHQRTQAKRSKKRTKKRPPRQRTRTRSVQLYLSDDEHESLMQILERRQCTLSELVRFWIGRSTAMHLRADRRSVEPDDPRQVTIAAHLARS